MLGEWGCVAICGLSAEPLQYTDDPPLLRGKGVHPPSALFKERYECFHTRKHRISTPKHVLETFGNRSKSVPKWPFWGSETLISVLLEGGFEIPDFGEVFQRSVFGGRWGSS